MKKAVVLLSILSVALAAALWLNRQNAEKQIHHAEAEIGSLSNHLAEAEMKLNHQEQMNHVLGSNLTNRTEELAKATSDLAKTRSHLAQSQGETRSVQGELQAAVSQVQAVKADATALANRIEELNAELRSKDGQVAKAQEELAKAEAARVALSYQLGALQQENDKLDARLQNPELLRAQIAAIQRQRAATGKQTAHSRPDYGLDLELQPDGSVRPVGPAFSEPPPPSAPVLRPKL